MKGLTRQGHFLGSKLRALRRRNGLTLDELSARCVQVDAGNAPSVSYLSMVETGKRVPSPATLAVLAAVFGKPEDWFLDRNTEVEPTAPQPGSSEGSTLPLEPSFLFSKQVLQSALPELLAQTGTSGAQFARLLVRVWQETHHNDVPDIERAAEAAGGRRMPLTARDLLGIARDHGIAVRWFDDDGRGAGRQPLRARFGPARTLQINRRLRDQEARLKYELAYCIGHAILHGGDGTIPPRYSAGLSAGDADHAGRATIATRELLMAWRDFECTAFADALLCPRAPFRHFLARERHRLAAYGKLGVTPAVVMRRMTAVSPYRHWHFFDAYPPGYLQSVYRGNGIPLPWGNMSLVPDPCPRWAVFRLLQSPEATRARQATGDAPLWPPPTSQLSIMDDGGRTRLYCCHSIVARDSTETVHVMSVGVDLAPALAAQGFDAGATVAEVAAACRRGGGEGAVPTEAARQLRTVSHVLNIAWIADALALPAAVICPRSRGCPRPQRCADARS
jgi:transcriptional regulator with XRE-family HTH domain